MRLDTRAESSAAGSRAHALAQGSHCASEMRSLRMMVTWVSAEVSSELHLQRRGAWSFNLQRPHEQHLLKRPARAIYYVLSTSRGNEHQQVLDSHPLAPVGCGSGGHGVGE